MNVRGLGGRLEILILAKMIRRVDLLYYYPPTLGLGGAGYAYRAKFCKLEARASKTALLDSKMSNGETSSAGKARQGTRPRTCGLPMVGRLLSHAKRRMLTASTPTLASPGTVPRSSLKLQVPLDRPAAAVAVPVAAMVVAAPPQLLPRVCNTQNIDYSSMMVNRSSRSYGSVPELGESARACYR